MKHPSIWLRREGGEKSGDAVVLIEIGGEWIELIREPCDSCFSHCIHHGGIKKAIEESADKLAFGNLESSGGIAEAP